MDPFRALELQGAEAYVAAVRALEQEDRQALSSFAEEYISEVSDTLLTLMKKNLPDSTATLAVGLLVGLLNVGDGPAEDAAAAIRILVSRGTHSDTIREAGAIPHLVKVLRDGGGPTKDSASAALAHLVMQRASNREELHRAGGVAELAFLLREESGQTQAAEYAAAILSTLIVCDTHEIGRAARDEVRELPSRVLERHRNLSEVLTTMHPMPAVASHHAALAPVIAPAEPHVTAEQLGWFSAAWRRLCSIGRAGHRRADEPSPSEFVCPITHEAMSDPVIASDGMAYERQSIRHVIDRGNGLSPLTREPLARDVYPSFHLRRSIASWHQEKLTEVGVQMPHPMSVALLAVVVAGLVAPLVVWAYAELVCSCICCA